MPAITYHVVIAFARDDDGTLVAEQAIEAPSASSAIRRAEVVAQTKGGAVAFTRTGDPDTGEFTDAFVLGKFGDVPDDLSEL